MSYGDEEEEEYYEEVSDSENYEALRNRQFEDELQDSMKERRRKYQIDCDSDENSDNENYVIS